MFRRTALIVPIAFLLLAGVRTEGQAKSAPTATDEVSRGGPTSQQYHYSSYGGGHGGQDPYGYTYAGLSFDLSTALFLALGAIIVLLALAAVIYPLLSKGSSSGWDRSSSYRSYNLAGTAEKVLTAIEKVYEAYNKRQ